MGERSTYTPFMALKVLRFVRRVPSGCIEWTGPTNGVGYGVVAGQGHRFYVHRLTYSEAVGPIPAGLDIDHLCRNTLCCNPAHLEAVTHRENTIRGSKGQQLACIHGHPFDAANTYISPAGARSCRVCRARRERERRASTKEGISKCLS